MGLNFFELDFSDDGLLRINPLLLHGFGSLVLLIFAYISSTVIKLELS